jgi:hypothetical protein
MRTAILSLPAKENAGYVDMQIVADGPESETQSLKGWLCEDDFGC